MEGPEIDITIIAFTLEQCTRHERESKTNKLLRNNTNNTEKNQDCHFLAKAKIS